MARDTDRKVKKHCKAPGPMRSRVTYKYADGPEQERAIEILAQLLADCSRRVTAEEREPMEPNEGVKRSDRGIELDRSSYGVYTMKGRAS